MGLLFVAAAGLAWRAIRLKHRLEWSERDRRRAADELNRRLSELFSLQELSYILSGSLQLERIVEQVVRYTDRKSTRLNSSHLVISYAVFCLKKKNTKTSVN